jgi:hypothetical protein
MKEFIETHQGMLNINCIKLIKIVSTEIENETVYSLQVFDFENEMYIIIGISDKEHVEKVYNYYKSLICMGE